MSPKMLRALILEEVKKFGSERDVAKEAQKVKQVDAADYADALENHIDFAKALKLIGADDPKRFAAKKKKAKK